MWKMAPGMYTWLGPMDTFCSLIKITIKPNRLLKPCFNKSVTQHPFNLTHYDKGKHIVQPSRM